MLITFLSLWSIIGKDLCKRITLYLFLVNKPSTEENFIKEIIYDLDLGGWIGGPQSEEIQYAPREKENVGAKN